MWVSVYKSGEHQTVHWKRRQEKIWKKHQAKKTTPGDKETWRWNEEVQETVKRKRTRKKEWGITRDQEDKQRFWKRRSKPREKLLTPACGWCSLRFIIVIICLIYNQFDDTPNNCGSVIGINVHGFGDTALQIKLALVKIFSNSFITLQAGIPTRTNV